MILSSLTVLFGLVIGSFLTAYTWRWPRGESVQAGRSKCPHCKSKISWYDNIPFFSYLILKGRCRSCGKKISIRYPLIEGATALIFYSLYYAVGACTNVTGSPFRSSLVCDWQASLGWWTLPFILLIASILIAIFIIDLENQTIPDELTFLLLIFTVSVILFSSNGQLYQRLFSGFMASFALLSLNLGTKGRGMGLGDVKLAIFGGTFFGWPLTYVWILTSFVTGGIVSAILLIMKRKKFGSRIAFGPFLVAAFFLVLLFSESFQVLMPF